MVVRYRVDGRLKRRPEPLDMRFHPPLVSRLKALGRMDIAEKRRAQDGRLSVEHGRRQIDFRLSTVPTRFGEKLVLRILDPQTVLIDLERLILHDPTYRAMRWMIEQPQGLVIIAGPTGSGKTTTIYSAMLRLREDEINIVTIEDPIEYTIEGITQVQVNDAAGVSFANSVRHFLRQDPDVIVVGETRDPQTAATTVEAALTGHLVFTSLHANDALGSVVRMREMGVESFLLAHTLVGVVSQRLLRRVCPHCRQPTTYHPDLIMPLGLFGKDEGAGGFSFMKGSGCLNCNYQGFRGRVGVFEVLRVDDRLRPLIAAGESMPVIEKMAMETGLFQPLREHCRHLLVNGITTPEEIARVLFVTD
jgi:general secretion pathway protein E